MTYRQVCNQINTTNATRGAETAHSSGSHEFTPGFQWGSCYSIFSFMCMSCRSLFVLFLLAIVLSVLLQYTDSNYAFGFFKLFFRVTFFTIICLSTFFVYNDHPLLLLYVLRVSFIAFYLWQSNRSTRVLPYSHPFTAYSCYSYQLTLNNNRLIN